MAEILTWHQLLEFVVALAIGFIGMGLTQWLKIQLKIADKLALLLTVAVSLVLAVGELLATGAITGESFQLAALPATLGGIFSLATIFYKLLLADGSAAG